MCRDVSSEMMPDCTNCVKVRNTVSLDRPHSAPLAASL
jgi:hypothetical protein